MGSRAEWLHAAVEGGYSGIFLFVALWVLNLARGEKSARQKSLDYIGAVYFGILMGLGAAFDSRMWHWPLSIVTAIVFASYLVVGYAFRHEIAANWRRSWTVWRPRFKRLLPRSN